MIGASSHTAATEYGEPTSVARGGDRAEDVMDGEADLESAASGRPAHRPSRRSEIVRAATNVFSRLTYAEATVEDIAKECNVAPTAVYYHFGGKEELFDQAFESCLAGFSAMVDSVRNSAEVLNEDALREVIYAGWAWWRTHPVEARFLTLHLNGATPQSRRTYEAWQERHAQRAFDYLSEDERPARTSRKAREQYAVRLLGNHFLSALLPISQTAWLEGSLSRLPVAKVEAALADVLVPIMMGAGQPDPA